MMSGSETVQLKPERPSLPHYIGPNICDEFQTASGVRAGLM